MIVFTARLLIAAAICLSSIALAIDSCGTTISPQDVQIAEAHFASHAQPAPNSHITIPVHVHIAIEKWGSNVYGDMTDAQVQASVDFLNRAFVAARTSFDLVNVTRTIDMDRYRYAYAGDPEEREMKKQMRAGGPETLNIYTVSMTWWDVAGYASFPYQYASDPIEDGIVFNPLYMERTFPDVPHWESDAAHVLVHNVGHWVGLYHPSEGGCAGEGDYVPDTAPADSLASGCPVGRNTCPGDAQEDPIHNFMDFTNDACRNEFTPGQIERLRMQLATYRGYV